MIRKHKTPSYNRHTGIDQVPHIMATSRVSPTTPLPPLLALPLELKQQIFSSLSDDKGFKLSLTILRRTHPILRNSIPYTPLAPLAPFKHNRTTRHKERSNLRRDRSDLLFFAELYHPYLFPPSSYPCYDCLKIRDEAYFEDNKSLSSADSSLVTSVCKPFGSAIAYERKCNDCLTREDTELCGVWGGFSAEQENGLCAHWE